MTHLKPIIKNSMNMNIIVVVKYLKIRNYLKVLDINFIVVK